MVCTSLSYWLNFCWYHTYCVIPSGYHYGASPAIFACIGVLANWLVKNRELWDEYKLQKGFYYLMGYFVLSNMLGVSTLIFHFMGFVVGFLLGFMVKEKAR